MLGNFTDIVVLLDRSGSMLGVADATREAYNGFLAEQAALADTARFTLVQFSTPSDYFYSHKNTPIKAVQPLTDLDYYPTGHSTALLDSLGRLIDERGREYQRQPESSRPSRVVFVVHTDGLENSSMKETRESVRTRILRQTRTYNWNFVYLGANQDAILTAEAYGIPMTSAITYTSNAGATRNAIQSVSNYVTLARSGELSSFTTDDRVKAVSESSSNG